MTDTTTPVELEIPQAARAAWEDAVREDGLRGAGAFIIAPMAVRAAAPFIVAAELRRLIDTSITAAGKVSDADPGWRAGVSDTLTRLRARADELDGGA